MKSLYISFQPIQFGSGISNKILAQYRALKDNGLDIDFCCQKIENGKISYFVNDTLLYGIGTGLSAHIALYYKYRLLIKYIEKNKVEFVYIRYIHIANPFFNNFLRLLYKKGIKIYLEIPTYPYDGERSAGLLKNIQMRIEKHYRNRLYKSVSRIITFSNDKYIFNIPTIVISNGLDMDRIALRNPIAHKGVNLIAIAMLCRWHGYDRLIEGIGIYYQSGGLEDINIFIIGNAEKVIDEYRIKAIKYNILDRIHFEGVKSGNELEPYFDMADIAIGSLACHRKNVYSVKSLKNVEYAARGIVFAYSEDNDDFDSKPYVLKLKPDESPIDTESLLSFIRANSIKPLEIRNSIESTLSWRNQMRKIVSTIYN